MKKISEKILNGFKTVGKGIGFIVKMFMSLAVGIFEGFSKKPKKKRKVKG